MIPNGRALGLSHFGLTQKNIMDNSEKLDELAEGIKSKLGKINKNEEEIKRLEKKKKLIENNLEVKYGGRNN